MSLFDCVDSVSLNKKISDFTPDDYDNYRQACTRWSNIRDIAEQRSILSMKPTSKRLKKAISNFKGDRYIALCVSPKSSNKFYKFKEKCMSFLKRACFARTLCVFEQRGSNEATRGHGMHVHFILERNLDIPISHIRRYSKSSFRNTCDVENSNFFHFKPFCTKYLEDRINYLRINGKTGEGKQDKQKQDIIWRKEKNLRHFYVNNWPEIDPDFPNGWNLSEETISNSQMKSSFDEST